MTTRPKPDHDSDSHDPDSHDPFPTRATGAIARSMTGAAEHSLHPRNAADRGTPPVPRPAALPAVPALPLVALAVRPAGPGVCRICFDGVAPGRRVCRGCESAERRLHVALEPITPISLAIDGSDVYGALRQYKWARWSEQVRRQRLRLAGLIAGHLSEHRSCMAPDGWDAVTVVPSLRGRAGPHPLVGVLAMIDELADSYVPALRTASWSGSFQRLEAADGWYVPHPLHRSRIRGARFLLVDDTYTTGAHLHSARAALLAGGASTVTSLVIGRRVNRTWTPCRPIVDWASQAGADGPWRWCVHCSPR